MRISRLYLPGTVFLLAIPIGLSSPRVVNGQSQAAANYAVRVRAESLYVAGNCADAIPMYRQLLQSAQTDGTLWTRLGQCLRATGDRGDAIAALRTAYTLGGAKTFDLTGTYGAHQDRIALSLAQLYASHGPRDSAIVWAERLIAIRGPRSWLAQDSTFERLRSDAVFRGLAGMLPNRPLGRVEGWRWDLAFSSERHSDSIQGERDQRSAVPFWGPPPPCVDASLSSATQCCPASSRILWRCWETVTAGC